MIKFEHEIKPLIQTFGWKFLALEKFTLTDKEHSQNWYGIRIIFFRIWIARYRW